jgi:hypothetical protein
MFNPWPSLSPSQARTKKKTARLIGKESGKVVVLVKLHDYRRRALYVYHLPQKKMVHIAQPSPQQWNQYATAGVEIPHPGGIQATDVDTWCRFGQEQAENLGLTVAE